MEKPVIKKILIPVDFSEYSVSALRYATGMAELYGAELRVVYVAEPAVYPPDFSMGQIVLPTLNVTTEQRAREELEGLVARETGGLVPTVCLVRSGKPFFEIIQAAAEEDCDLIIIASHGHTGVEHLLFGSTAEKVVRKAPCPVLTLRMPLKGFNYKDMLGSGQQH